MSVIKVPLEWQEQKWLKDWCDLHPILRDYFISHPNDGKRSAFSGCRMKQTGLRPGVSDIQIPYPVGNLHGFWGELKRTNGSFADLRLNQKEWLLRMHDTSYRSVVAFGWEQMKFAIEDYLAGEHCCVNPLTEKIIFTPWHDRRNKSFDSKTRIWVYK